MTEKTETKKAAPAKKKTTPRKRTTKPKKKTLAQIVDILQAPTPPQEIKFYGIAPKDGKAVAIPYVDMVFVSGRLDSACGAFGWQSDIRMESGEISMGIGVLNPETGSFQFRWDVGNDGKKSEHGALEIATRAMKRAASQWGVARDLREIPKLKIACNSWKGSDGKVRWSSWKESPNDAIEKFIVGQSGNGHQRGSDKDAPTEEAAKEATKPAGEATPGEARKMTYDLLVSDLIAYTPQQANAWLIDQEREFGRTLEAYRNMYAGLKRSNAPPTNAG